MDAHGRNAIKGSPGRTSWLDTSGRIQERNDLHVPCVKRNSLGPITSGNWRLFYVRQFILNMFDRCSKHVRRHSKMDEGSPKIRRYKSGESSKIIINVSPSASLDSSDGCSTNQSYVSSCSERDATR